MRFQNLLLIANLVQGGCWSIGGVSWADRLGSSTEEVRAWRAQERPVLRLAGHRTPAGGKLFKFRGPPLSSPGAKPAA